MRKLNGITINGEYLGNSVVINGMFRAICTISPVIMRDFVTIVNKIEQLEDAVKIKNFNCGFNCIDIEFGNSLSKGIASLYFKLINGEPELTNYKLIIDDKEYSPASKSSQMTNPSKPVEQAGAETERQRRLRELKERKLEQQKKLLELKKQKIEELKKRAEERKEERKLSPEELKAKRRQELLQKKKEELLKKKREANSNISAEDTSSVDANESLPVNNSTEADNRIPDSSTSGKQNGENTLLNKENMPETTEQGSEGIRKSTDTESSSQLIDNAQKGVSSQEISENSTEKELSADIDEAALAKDGSDFSDTDLNRTVDDNYTDSENNSGSMTGDDIDDITDEELARLEAELDAELDQYSDFSNDYDSEEAMLNDELNKLMASEQQYQSSSSDQSDMRAIYSDLAKEINDGLSQGLIQGLSQGLSEGLSQGLSQGLSALFNNTQGSGFNPSATEYENYPQQPQYNPPQQDSAQNIQTQNVQSQNVQPQNYSPDFGMIDAMNNDAAMSARETYSYDEDVDLDDLSDLYSDFYDQDPNEQMNNDIFGGLQQQPPVNNELGSDIAALQAELSALRAQALPRKDLMTKEEFLDVQKQLEEAKEKKRRQKFKIVGSRGKINASALDDGIFVAGKKFYKWGDTKKLES